jgi:hypothetical protein
MAPNKPKWPKCGCEKRCDKRKYHSVGSRELKARGHQPGSAIKSAQLSLVTRKYAPQKLRFVVELARVFPIETVIAREAGMSKSALRYALMGSREGHPGDLFDMEIDDGIGNSITERFHILFEDAIEEGFSKIEAEAFELAMGRARKVLEYQGKITYKQDPRLVAQGLPKEETYILDENGNRVPETIPIIDPEMIRWLLARWKPEIYGKRPKAPEDPERRGGVLVVGNPMSREAYEKRFGGPQPLVEVELEGLPAPDNKS